jgi:flagellar basal body-associated protein FliL
MAKSDAVKDPATKGKLKLILLLVLGLLLAIGLSVGATWFFMHKSEPLRPDPAWPTSSRRRSTSRWRRPSWSTSTRTAASATCR